ncbi:hypothetical protein CC80DRAFT_531217 [Byssothecium circinans]|uniref:BRCT domain-containing protein n=1 Tax=Byssothecium circinans TaxID=147558 RepID=A0A6A5UC79_9PLEO|nr:hypothetical protein CC80DRAFT_531217 [Byssothecium circinans]
MGRGIGCLKNLVITAAGEVGPGKGNEKIKKWINANGGIWVPKVSERVTHLIASKDAWKRSAEAVKQAQKLGNIWIISYEWLEDSLTRKRKLPEKKYTWEVLRYQRRVSKTMKRMGPPSDTMKFKAGCAKALEDTGSGTSLRPSKSTFFVPALDDIRKRREAREVEEREEREAKRAAAAENMVTGVTKNAALDALRQAMARGVSKTSSQGTSKLARKAESEVIPAPASSPKDSLAPTPQPMEDEDEDDVQDTHNEPNDEPDNEPSSPSLRPSPQPQRSPSNPPRISSSSHSLPHPHSQPPKLCSNANTNPSQPPTPAKKPSLLDLYHIYTDLTGFAYDLLLLRTNPCLNNFARYDLRLYESHTKPHVYCTFVRYVPPGGGKSGISSAANIRVNGVENGGANGNDFSAAMEACLQSLDTQRNQSQNPTTTTTTMTSTWTHQPASTPSSSSTAEAEAEAARLTSLITRTPPTPSTIHKTLICPENSSFSTALLAFRHAFRDLTLLTWEERSDDPLNPSSNPTGTSTQRLRAQQYSVEPFIWRNRPLKGQCIGFMPAINSATVDASYTRNRFNLPGLDSALGTDGSIGSALHREVEAARRAEEEAREAAVRKAKDAAKAEREREKRERPNFNRPLFNGVNGPPSWEAWGGYWTPEGSPGGARASMSPGASGNGRARWSPYGASTSTPARTQSPVQGTGNAFRPSYGAAYSTHSAFTRQSHSPSHSRTQSQHLFRPGNSHPNPNTNTNGNGNTTSTALSRAIGPLRPAVFTDLSTRRNKYSSRSSWFGGDGA